MNGTALKAPEAALGTALARLVDRGVLAEPQAAAVRTEFDAVWSASPASQIGAEEDGGLRTALLIEVGGYVGAAFVVAAAAAIVVPSWDELSQAVRLGVLAGPAAILLVAAFLMISGTPGGWSAYDDGRHGPRRRLVAAVLTAAGGLAGGVAWVLTDGGPATQYVVPPVLLLAWGAGYLACRGALLHLSAALGLGLTVVWELEQNRSSQWLVTGVALVVAGAVWAALTLRGVVAERPLGLVVAGTLAFVGAETTTAADVNLVGYLLLALLAAVGLAGYVRTRELGALIVGGAALAVVVPQAVIDYTDGALGAAGVLLVCGLSVVAASALGMRLHRTTP